MDSSSKNSKKKAGAVQPELVAPQPSARPAGRPVPMRMLATAGILLGFATGLTLNFLSQPQARAFIDKAQMAVTHSPARAKQDVALVDPSPVTVIAED